MSIDTNTALIMAGIPQLNAALYHRIRFLVGDPVAYLQIVKPNGATHSTLILRDIELERARRAARADTYACPADYAPASGLSGDRETATAQAAAECLRRAGVTHAVGDRSLPLIFVDMLRAAGISVAYDASLGVTDRRSKDAAEIKLLRHAQEVTEQAMLKACRTVALAEARADRVLMVDGERLSSERLRAMIDHWLIDCGFSNPPSIVAGGPVGADCHEHGHGLLRTGEPVIVDIFPCDGQSHYNGDCTRTVVHGEIPAEVARMHAAVCAAKRAATSAVRAGATGEDVHRATIGAIEKYGYHMGFPPAGSSDAFATMPHGTGHGVGLQVHEPPLLDMRGPELVAGDVLTIEPGLYCLKYGGVRVEDMVVVTQDGCENLNKLPEGLDWR
jgi:Xaa-Pro aminopeptidase